MSSRGSYRLPQSQFSVSPLPPMNIHVTCPRPYSPTPSSGHQATYNHGYGQTNYGKNLDPNQNYYSSYNYNPGYQTNMNNPVSNYSQNLSQEVDNMFRTLPKPASQYYVRRYDPGSLQDQEREVYEEEKLKEQIAIKTTPYRSQAVVSPKPKTKHDHVLGSYLYMQHYPDAPLHGSPIPPAPVHHVDPLNQARFTSYVQQVDPHAAEKGVKVPYNTPIGLYSRENALNTLKQTNPLAANQSVRLTPEPNIADGLENLTSSPTWQLVQAMDSQKSGSQQQGHQQQQQQQQQHPRNMNLLPKPYSPMMPEYTTESFHGTGRVSPQQSSSFKSLMNALLEHPGC